MWPQGSICESRCALRAGAPVEPLAAERGRSVRVSRSGGQQTSWGAT